jgi:hypothetical protein
VKRRKPSPTKLASLYSATINHRVVRKVAAAAGVEPHDIAATVALAALERRELREPRLLRFEILAAGEKLGAWRRRHTLGEYVEIEQATSANPRVDDMLARRADVADEVATVIEVLNGRRAAAAARATDTSIPSSDWERLMREIHTCDELLQDLGEPPPAARAPANRLIRLCKVAAWFAEAGSAKRSPSTEAT